MAIRNFRDLVVWQRAMELSVRTYEVSNAFPREEIYGLTSQIRRASVSIPSNIAEGHGRNNDREFLRFLDIAMGSLRELETQMMLATQLGFAGKSTGESVLDLATEVGKLVNALRRTLNNALHPQNHSHSPAIRDQPPATS